MSFGMLLRGSKGASALVSASVPFAVLASSTRHYSSSTSSAAAAAATTASVVNSGQDPITIYQYKICPYCSRPKTFLEYMKVPYEAVEVNPMTKAELKKVTTELKKVPVMTYKDEVVGDSIAIIDSLKKTLSSDKEKSKIMDKLFVEDTDKWVKWSEKLSIMIYPNITRNFDEAWQCFDYTTSVDTWGFFNQYSNRILGPVFMYLANGKIKKKYGIVNEREEMFDYLKEWIEALGSNKYLHGDKVTMPDLMVYGVLKSIAGLKTFDDIMNRDERLKKWFDRVDGEVTASTH